MTDYNLITNPKPNVW